MEAISNLEQLPAGTVFTRRGPMRLKLEAPVLFGFDYQWLHEVAPGALRGATGLRFDADAPAMLAAELTGEWEARVERASETDLRLTLEPVRAGPPEAMVQARVSVTLPEMQANDALTAALVGAHPLAWLRRILTDMGSLPWRQLARDLLVFTRHLEAIGSVWERLSAKAEAALWRALSGEEEWQPFSSLVRALVASRNKPAEPLTAGLRVNSAAWEWVRAVTSPAPRIAGGDESSAVREAASDLLPLAGTKWLADLAMGLRAYAIDQFDLARPGSWLPVQTEELLGTVRSQEELDRCLAPWRELARRIYGGSRAALERGLGADLTAGASQRSPECAFFSARFPSTAEGLALLNRVAAGDLTAALAPDAAISLEQGQLSGSLRQRRYVELHLPMLTRQQWRNEFNTLFSARVTEEGGRVVLDREPDEPVRSARESYQSTLLLAGALTVRGRRAANDNFAIVFRHRRKVGPREALAAWDRMLEAYGLRAREWPEGEAELTVRLPGSLALAWTESPKPREPEFTAAFGRVSMHLQEGMRLWLPAVYFASAESYRDLRLAYPLLVYQASLPFRTAGPTAFTYDPKDRSSVEQAVATAEPRLPALLEQVHARLLRAGFPRVAEYYEQRCVTEALTKALWRSPEFPALLRADAFLIEDVIRLAGAARVLRGAAKLDPAAAVRRLQKESAYFVRSLQGHLRRVCRNDDFLALSSLVLVEATAALSGGAWTAEVTLEVETAEGRSALRAA
jgi:hypothetical protein